MCRHFTRPKLPMGEAWFMSEKRNMFDNLSGDLEKVPVRDLMRPLGEIASGTHSFGFYEEWNDWFHYLLPRLIPRAHEHYVAYLLEYLVTAFVTQYPDGVKREPYKGFHADALNTLGKSIMDRQCWDGNDIVVGRILRPSNNNPRKVWLWWDASGDFSASMFFCLKYLPHHAVPGWLRSVLRIKSAHWRAQLVVWLVGVHKLLNGEIGQPAQFKDGDGVPSISWEWSHVLDGEYTGDRGPNSPAAVDFLPDENRMQALNTISEEVTEELLLNWLSSIEKYGYLESELGDIPSQFANLYVY